MCAGAGSDIRWDAINGQGLNDKFSSVSVPKGLQVLAHEHNHISGYTQVFVEDTTDLGFWTIKYHASQFQKKIMKHAFMKIQITLVNHSVSQWVIKERSLMLQILS